MNKLNGRVTRLEEIAPAPETADDNHDALLDLCQRVIDAIDSGEIITMAERGPLVEGFYHDETDYRPTEAGNLAGDERTRVHSLLHMADKIVVDVANQTGWRSPIGQAKPQEWQAYHANSVDELRTIMMVILDATAD